MSTSLYLSSNKNDTRYTLPYVDPLTGVRSRDTFWLHQARKADVIMMNRGPIPAPAWTYDGTPHGNWSYIDCLHLNRSAIVDSTSPPDARVQIFNAALHATLTQFLPELHRTLRTINTDQDIQRRLNLWIWHGSLGCNRNFSTSDPWSLFYQAQGLDIPCLIHIVIHNSHSIHAQLRSPQDPSSLRNPLPSSAEHRLY
ncbi:hypothetical protein IW261DRAFT_785119 [Armillaria novae-zelandiae]|uniref:Uncharacterized protein n=1 Tax=Armillaria novae-zelandiae TaxID=153914 RepID=A0AA39UEH2_9AGAR|nr:hypothetical protein IW261DRAFT_785119 [Armillaria novae-zelandiae]